jgi:hypothetical protein
MQKAGPMNGRESFRGLDRVAERNVDRQSAALSYHAGHVGALDIFHGDPRHPLVLADPVDPYDVALLHYGQRTKVSETRPRNRRRSVRGQHLDYDSPSVGRACDAHDAHPLVTETSFHDVRSDGSAGIDANGFGCHD